MPTSTLPTLSEDQIDDLLYLARTGSTHDLESAISHIAKSLSVPTSTILTATVDPTSGNGLLHMASANGHTETLTTLLICPSPTSTFSDPNSEPSLNINLQNASGNTPLHWAALNGHLDAVKVLVKVGADTKIENRAGQDAVAAAEVNQKKKVVVWLLFERRSEEEKAKGEAKAEEEGQGEGADEEMELEEEKGEENSLGEEREGEGIAPDMEVKKEDVMKDIDGEEGMVPP